MAVFYSRGTDFNMKNFLKKNKDRFIAGGIVLSLFVSLLSAIFINIQLEKTNERVENSAFLGVTKLFPQQGGTGTTTTPGDGNLLMAQGAGVYGVAALLAGSNVTIATTTGERATITISSTAAGGDPNVILSVLGADTYLRASTTGNAWLFPDGFLSQASSTVSSNLTVQGTTTVGTLRFEPETEQTFTAASETITANTTHLDIQAGADLVFTSTPTITDGENGQFLILHNVGTTTLDIQDQTALAGSGVFLGRSESTISASSTMTLYYSVVNSIGQWYVISNPNTASAGASASVLEVRNTSGSAISAGKAVYVTGWNNGQQRILVDLADADDSSAMPAIGITAATISNGQNGQVIMSGNSIGFINTTGASVGDGVWVSTTAGDVVFTRPTTDDIQKIGEVTRSNASGNILVFGAGRANDLPNNASTTASFAQSLTANVFSVGQTATSTFNSAGLGFLNGFVSRASSTVSGDFFVSGNATTTGTHDIGALFINGDYITNFAGTGLTVTSNALVADLGTDIDLASAEVTGTLGAGNGGTSIASYSAGDFIYAIGATTISKLAAQTDAALTMSGTNPDWQERNDIVGTADQLTISNGTNVIIGNGTDVTLSIPSLFIISNASTTQISSSGSSYFATSTGNVGIRTMSPQELLHVGVGTDASDISATDLLVTRAGASSLSVRDSTNNVETFLFASSVGGIMGTITNDPLSIKTNNTNAIFIDASQKVGIGTTTPWGVLSVEMGIEAYSFLVGNQGSTTPAFSIGGVNTDGYIGIGSSTPFARLSVGADGAIVTTENNAATSSSMTIDWTDGNQQLIRQGGDAITINFVNFIKGQTLRLNICNPDVAGGAVTFGTQVLWDGGTAPTLTTTADKCDILTFLATEATSTLEIFGSSVLNF